MRVLSTRLSRCLLHPHIVDGVLGLSAAALPVHATDMLLSLALLACYYQHLFCLFRPLTLSRSHFFSSGEELRFYVWGFVIVRMP